jgi:hypothetical protein
MRIPEASRSKLATRNVDLVQAEIAQEKAAALGRIYARLRQALDRLQAFDAAQEPGDETSRDELLAAAGEALWFYVVQREACGLRDTDRVLHELRIPREVQLRMGLASSRRRVAMG